MIMESSMITEKYYKEIGNETVKYGNPSYSSNSSTLEAMGAGAGLNNSQEGRWEKAVMLTYYLRINNGVYHGTR